MTNLFNIDINQIRHNEEIIKLIKWDGLTVYENKDIHAVHYTVDNNSTDTLTNQGLPSSYSSASDEIIITKLNGTITRSTDTLLSDIKKIKIYYPSTSTLFKFKDNGVVKTVDYIDTFNFTDMSYMFEDCTQLTYVNGSNFDTSQVTDMFDMFYKCNNLTDLDVSGWDTSQVTNMGFMFHQCNKLKSLDVSNWNTSQVTNMNYLFSNCHTLTELDLSSWDTSKVTNMNCMFLTCSSLETLNLSNFDTSNANCTNMLNSCKNLRVLRLDNCSLSTVIDILESQGFPTIETDGPYTYGHILCSREKCMPYSPSIAIPQGWQIYWV